MDSDEKQERQSSYRRLRRGGKKNVYAFVIVLTIIASVLFYHTKEAEAAPCAVGGDVTINVSCEINGAAAYNNLTIINNAVVSSGVGQKIDITAVGKVQIDAGSGIDVSGRGDNITVGQKGGNGTSNGSCSIPCGGNLGSGGGGGGYGGSGGAGGTDATENGGAGGGTYGSNIAPVDLGSIGGLGGGNVTGNGMGGGAVKIQAKQIILNGYIKANGTNGSDPVGCDGTGAGGGGSGGSIWLLASNSFNFTGGNLSVKGGNGGMDVNCGAAGWDGAGGGGGGGRISLQYNGPKIGIGTHNESFGPGGGGSEPGANGANGTFYEDPCYQKVCGNYCVDLIAYRSGSCDTLTGNCQDATTTNCADADPCTFDDCNEGVCSSSANLCGGIVPCGKLVNDPATPWNEHDSCTLCSLILMGQLIIEFLVKMAAVAALVSIAAGGLLYIFAIGNQGTIEKAKSMIKYTLIGFVIVFIAWALINTIMATAGYIDPLGGNWYMINC